MASGTLNVMVKGQSSDTACRVDVYGSDDPDHENPVGSRTLTKSGSLYWSTSFTLDPDTYDVVATVTDPDCGRNAETAATVSSGGTANAYLDVSS